MEGIKPIKYRMRNRRCSYRIQRASTMHNLKGASLFLAEVEKLILNHEIKSESGLRDEGRRSVKMYIRSVIKWGERET